jgi:ubiquinone/menaquinone biosynthesis C-methylase UbiE
MARTLAAFPWEDLPTGSTVVDVGGGIGSTTMVLAGRYENLNFVVQDREFVVEMGKKVCFHNLFYISPFESTDGLVDQ